MKLALLLLPFVLIASCSKEEKVSEKDRFYVLPAETTTPPPPPPPPPPVVIATPIPEATPVQTTDAQQDEADQNYGTFTPGRETVRSWSLFTTAERNGCKLPMILYAANGARVSREQASFTAGAFEKAVQAWTGAIAADPSWPCGESVALSWQTQRTVPGTIAVFIDAAVQRSYAVVGGYEIRLSPQYTNPGDPYAERVILHEMGHMVGLSDTYTERGYQQPIGQPFGIMNNLYNVQWLMPDDVAGANALYRYITGRGQFCDGGYKQGGAYENKNRVAFCVPN